MLNKKSIKKACAVVVMGVLFAGNSVLGADLGFGWIGNADEKAAVRIQSQYLERDIKTLENLGFATESADYTTKLRDMRTAGSLDRTQTYINTFLAVLRQNGVAKNISRYVASETRQVGKCRGHSADYSRSLHSDARNLGATLREQNARNKDIAHSNVWVEEPIPDLANVMFFWATAFMSYKVEERWTHKDDIAACSSKETVNVEVPGYYVYQKVDSVLNSLLNLQRCLEDHNVNEMKRREASDRLQAKRDAEARAVRAEEERRKAYQAQQEAAAGEAKRRAEAEATRKQQEEELAVLEKKAAEAAEKMASDREAGRAGVNMNAAAW